VFLHKYRLYSQFGETRKFYVYGKYLNAARSIVI